MGAGEIISILLTYIQISIINRVATSQGISNHVIWFLNTVNYDVKIYN